MTPWRPVRPRRGFTLLEVMISLAILVVSLFILMETQGTAALMTMEAERMMTATQLAQDKLAEVRFLVENEGFQSDDVYEEGDFDDFGDEALDIEFAELSEYHFEYLVTEIDLGLGGDIAGTMSNLQDRFGGQDGAASAAQTNAAAGGLGGLPISEEMITEALNPFIREVRVRVWWGEDQEEAEDLGNEVVLTTHLIQPNANVLGSMGLGGLGGGGGMNAGMGGMGGMGMGGMGGAGRTPPRARRPTRSPGASNASFWGGNNFNGFGAGAPMGPGPGTGGAGVGLGGNSRPAAPTRSFDRGGRGGRGGGGKGR